MKSAKKCYFLHEESCQTKQVSDPELYGVVAVEAAPAIATQKVEAIVMLKSLAQTGLARMLRVTARSTTIFLRDVGKS